MMVQKNKPEMSNNRHNEVLNNFKSKLDFVRSQVTESGIEGIVVNTNSSVFKFRKGANHTRL